MSSAVVLSAGQVVKGLPTHSTSLQDGRRSICARPAHLRPPVLEKRIVPSGGIPPAVFHRVYVALVRCPRFATTPSPDA